MKLRNFLRYLNRRDTHFIPHIHPLSKIFLVFTIVIVSILLTKNILALTDAEGSGDMTIKIDTTGFTEQYLNKQKAIDSVSQESWIYESLASHAGAMNKALAGSATKEIFSGTGWIPGGLIGLTNNSIATLYNPPASGVEYIAQTINNFMGKPVYAANGFGFTKLNGIMTLWKTFRNAVYVLISLFFIIIGIMIMLRIKTSPQTTVTIQTALPKIITTLVLVTFSYAIAGLLIDFSYVVEGIVLSLIDSSMKLTTVLSNNVRTPSGLMNLNFLGFADIIYNSLVPSFVIGILTGILGVTTGVVAGLLATTGPGLILGLLAGSLVFLSIYIIILWQIVKLFFGLAKCYINILLKIIIAPLEIGLGVFPGSKVSFSSWIVQLIANIAVFPASIIFLVVAVIFTKTIGTNSSDLWMPNMFGAGWLFSGLIGMASLFILAQIPKIVPEFIFNIKPSPINKLVGDSVGGIVHSKALRTGVNSSLEGTAAKARGKFDIKTDDHGVTTATSKDRGAKTTARIINILQNTGNIKTPH